VLGALALARAGDATRAATLADQLNAELPVSTLVQRYWLPTIRAEIALVHEDPVEAVALLEAALDYELADTSSSGAPALYPAYVRGSAYLRADNGAAAAAEFQKMLEHRGLTGINPIGALARLGLARAHVLSGDTVKAKTEYQQFIALWKNADRESPVLEQATMEYRSLR
jgi:eukaryotic-like serine/threonine-protein kinase